MTKIPPDDILEGLYKLRIRESEKLKTVLELYDLEIHQKKIGPDYHRLKTMVKRSIEQIYEIRILAPETEIMKETPWSRIQGQNSVYKEFLEIVGNGKSNGQCSKGDNCSFRHDINKRAKMTQPNPSPNSFMQQNERNASRTRSPRGKVPVVECLDGLARITSKELAPIHSVKSGTLQNACSTRPRVVADSGKSAHMHIVRLMNNLVKGPKTNDDKSAVAMLKKNDLHESIRQPVVNRDKSHDRPGRPDVKRDTCHELKQGPVGRRSSNARQLGCVFHDMKPPKSILRKSSDMQKPIQRVKFTKAIARHTKIRDQNPSLGYICPGEPHQRSPNAPKFEDRSQEETEWQEQGAREAAWKLAKSVLKLKEQERATFFSPSENRCLPASNLKPEEREFVVDSGASMHMISKKDLNDAEMDTLTKSCSPTIVITANGEVQTHEEATVYVKELDIS